MKKIPKICHLYWDGSPMAWLQTRTVTTFHRLNPSWDIRVYIPKQKYTGHAMYVPDYTGRDYSGMVYGLNYVQIIDVDLADYNIDEKIHNILRSDIFRYKILYDHGGVWSDFDVLWIKPIQHIYNLTGGGLIPVYEMGASACRFGTTTGHNNISVLIAEKAHPLYQFMISECYRILETNTNRDSLLHQAFGTNMMDQLWPTLGDMTAQFHDVFGFPYKTFFPYSIFNMQQLYKTSDLSPLDNSVMCVHWFNGHYLSKEYINADGGAPDCSMTSILNMIKEKR